METPYGRAPLDIGSFVLDLSTVASLTDALQGQAMTSKLLTVAGPCAAAPGNYRVPIGTRVSNIIEQVGLAEPLAQVVVGGPLTGSSINTLDAVITKHTRGILLANTEMAKPSRPGPCIRCGWCQQDCPVGLDPAAILDIVERRTYTNAAAQRPLACLECGLCSYVCPSELPLARAVIQLKQFIKQENATRQDMASAG
jgi:electron transport complex protein RnfC